MQPVTMQLDAVEQAELTRCESVIERGLRTFVDVGNALLTIRDGRLYRREYWTFEEYCERRWGFSNRRANQFIEAATTIATLGTIVPELAAPAVESQVRPLTSLPPEQQAEAWKQAVETAPNGRVTAAHVQDVVDAMRARSSGEPVDFDTYMASRPDEQAEPIKPTWYQSSESDDWWTPQWLFDMVSEEIAFETDVCASDANHKCERYFTKEQDALAQDWTGACWMNPPYGRSGGVSIYHWIEKAYWAAMQGATVACFIPARTDTLWWWEFCIHGEIRFLKGRVKFANSNSIAPFPSAVVIFWPYVPTNRERVIWWETNGKAEVSLESE